MVAVKFTTPTKATNPTPSYFANPLSTQPIDADLRNGLFGPGMLGLCSVLSCTALIGFIIWRFVAWRRHYKTYIGYVSNFPRLLYIGVATRQLPV